MEKLYSISEVADKLGLASKTLRRWEETGKFVGNRTLGGQRRYSISDIQILDSIKHGVIDSSADLLTPQQAAALFGVSIPTITRWEDEGKIHPLITAEATYYPRPRLLAKMKELQQSPTPTITPTFDPINLTNTQPEPTLNRYTPPVAPPPTPTAPTHRTIELHIPNISLPRIKVSTIYSLATQILVAVVIVTIYNFYFAGPSTPLNNPDNQASTPASAENQATLTLLSSLLDASGNLKSPSLTTPRLTLNPVSPVSKPTPGNIYFDAGSQTVRVYANGAWQPLNGGANSPTFVAGSSTVVRASSTVSVVSDQITRDSHIVVTFTGDYSPARAYWISKNQGSFTLTTNAPVAADVSFDYLITK